MYPRCAALRAVVVLLIVQAVILQHASAQFGQSRRSTEDLFLLAPRPMQRLLAEGKLAISEERFADAIGAVYALLDEDNGALPKDIRGQDFFLEHPANRPYSMSLKSEAIRILSELPEKGREILELQFGVTAKQSLQQAVEQGDMASVARVARKFPHTEAGYDAKILVAQNNVTRGEARKAATTYQELLGYSASRSRFGVSLAKATAFSWFLAGDARRAETTLRNAGKWFPGQSIDIDGRQLSLEDTIDWATVLKAAKDLREADSYRLLAENWSIGGGAPDRAGVAHCGMPLVNARWVKDIHSSIFEGKSILNLKESRTRSGTNLLPGFELRIVDNLVLTKTTDTSLLAIDFETGNIRWPYFQFSTPADIGTQNYSSSQRPDQLSDDVQGRVWGNSAYGRFSCDVDRVYIINDDAQSNGNTLSCLGIEQEGLLLWQVGGAESLSTPELENFYFLGPPLAYQGQLLCLADSNGQTQLVALEPNSGKLVWSQQLASSTYPPIRMNRARQSQALSPSVSEGVVICPTGIGTVVAVDLDTRQLLWANTYEITKENVSPRFQSAFLNSRSYDPLQPAWQDPTAIASEGYVVLTPPDSDRIVTCDILTGEIRNPKLKRNLGRYVAGIANGRIILVAENGISWIRLDNGKVLVGPKFPDGKALAGKGIYDGSSLLLPLELNTVVRIDAENGELLDQVQVERPLGNLFAYKNQLLSVSETEVAAYFTRESLSDLVSVREASGEPLDAPTLAFQAQLALSDGKLDVALGQLMESNRLDPDNANTRYLLAEAILTGLENDFDRYLSLADEFGDVIEFGPQHFRFLQRVALGSLRAGDHVTASEHLLELMRVRLGASFSPPKSRSNEMRIDEDYQVDSDIWIASGLARAFENASAEEKAELSELIVEELENIEEEVVSFRRRKLRFLMWLPPADSAVLDLANELIEQGEATAAQPYLVALLHSSSPSTVQRAAELIGRPTPAEVQMLGHAGDLRLLTFQDVGVEGSPEQENALQDSILEKFQDPIPWSDGRIESTIVKIMGNNFGNPNMRYMNGAVIRQTQERFGRPQIRVALSARQLILYNNKGQNVCSITFNRATGDANDQLVSASIRGGLMFLETASELSAFDIERGLEYRKGAMLWRHSLSMQGRVEPPRFDADDNELGIKVFARQIGDAAAVVGPLTPSGIPVQKGTRIVMLNSLSGKELWRREGIQGRAEFACEAHKLSVTTTRDDKKRTRVFDCRDGLLLSDTEVLGEWSRWLTHNGIAVDYTYRFDGTGDGLANPMTIRIWRPADGTELALEKLKVGAKAVACEGRYLVIAEPANTVHFIDLDNPDEFVHLRHELPVNAKLDAIHSVRFRDRILVFSNAAGKGVTARDPSLFNKNTPVKDVLTVNGYVYAFDAASGNMIWDHPGRIINFQFPLMQPTDSPFAVFYRIRDKAANVLANVAVLDTRDGSLPYIFNGNVDAVSGFSMLLKPIKQQVELNLGMVRFLLNATELPKAPQPIVEYRSR